MFRRLAVAAVVLIAAGIGGNAAFDRTGSSEPPPATQVTNSTLTESTPAEWDEPAVTFPLVDVAGLAEVHASSRLEYDECRSDFEDTGADRTIGRNPLYFC